MDNRYSNYENYIEYLNATISLKNDFKYQAIDLFAGCGGLSLGFEAAGIKTYGYEMVEDCCKTYKKNLKGDCSCETLSLDTNYPNVDIVIGGPPCQPFSTSGSHKGKEDERNGFPIYIDAIRKIHPKIFMFENVRGLVIKHKDYFESVIKELESLGYVVQQFLVNASNFDVPQNRERVICIGTAKGNVFLENKAYKVTAGEALLDTIESEVDENLILTPRMDEYIATYEKKSCCKVPRDVHFDKPARTLTCRNLAGSTSDMQRVVLKDGRRQRLTTHQAARLQSFPDWFVFEGNKNSIYKQIGNAVPPFLAYNIALQILRYMEEH